MLIQALPSLPPQLPAPAALQRQFRTEQAIAPTAVQDQLKLAALPGSALSLKPPAQLFGQPAQPTAPVLPPVAGKVSLDLLSLNVYALPKPIGKNISERAAVIGSTLGRYDIAALQETFSRETGAIATALAVSGAAKYQNFKPSDHRFTNSGLQIFSKYPIIARDFAPFRLGTDSDALAKKGVAFTRVEVPGVGPVDVYDTHYQANGTHEEPWYKDVARKAVSLVLKGFDQPHEKLRLHDNQVLAELVAKHDKGYPVFVLGDFNTKETTVVYKDLITRLGLTDSFRALHPDAPGYTSDGPANPIKGGKSQSRIDFIFYRPGKSVDVKPVLSQIAYNKPGEFVSDHFGLHTRFELVKK